jgi:hypothetical protein
MNFSLGNSSNTISFVTVSFVTNLIVDPSISRKRCCAIGWSPDVPSCVAQEMTLRDSFLHEDVPVHLILTSQ